MNKQHSFESTWDWIFVSLVSLAAAVIASLITAYSLWVADVKPFVDDSNEFGTLKTSGVMVAAIVGVASFIAIFTVLKVIRLPKNKNLKR